MSDLEMNFYQNLATEIMCVVTSEYRRCVHNPRRCKKTRELEAWLLSPYGQLLSYGNGENIIRRIKSEPAQPRKENRSGNPVAQEIVDGILRDRECGVTYRELADKYKVSHNTVWRIVCGHTHCA